MLLFSHEYKTFNVGLIVFKRFIKKYRRKDRHFMLEDLSLVVSKSLDPLNGKTVEILLKKCSKRHATTAQRPWNLLLWVI